MPTTKATKPKTRRTAFFTEEQDAVLLIKMATAGHRSLSDYLVEALGLNGKKRKK